MNHTHRQATLTKPYDFASPRPRPVHQVVGNDNLAYYWDAATFKLVMGNLVEGKQQELEIDNEALQRLALASVNALEHQAKDRAAVDQRDPNGYTIKTAEGNQGYTFASDAHRRVLELLAAGQSFEFIAHKD